MEVRIHNPWLTYGIGIHRLREAGLAWGLLTVLNERPLALDEIHQLCTMFFVIEGQRSKVDLPHPSTDWAGFTEVLRQMLARERRMVWNPVVREKTEWINVDMLDRIYGSQQFEDPMIQDEEGA